MEHINTKELKYNPEAIKSCFMVKNNMTVALKDVKIVFLDSYLKKDLAVIEDYVTLIGIYAIIDENNNYAPVIAPIYNKLLVSKIDDATCTDGRLYKMLFIDKDSVMIDNNNFVIDDSQIYRICDLFYVKANIPFFINYEIVSELLIESSKYNKSSIGSNALVFKILASILARGKDKSVYYRNSEEFGKVPPNWVSINNIYYSLPSTSSKLVGGYYGAAVGVAVMKPEKTVSKIETILMGREV